MSTNQSTIEAAPLPDPLPPFLTLDQVCALLQFKRRTIYGWVQARKIPFRKMGGHLRFPRDEILNWNKPEDGE